MEYLLAKCPEDRCDEFIALITAQRISNFVMSNNISDLVSFLNSSVPNAALADTFVLIRCGTDEALRVRAMAAMVQAKFSFTGTNTLEETIASMMAMSTRLEVKQEADDEDADVVFMGTEYNPQLERKKKERKFPPAKEESKRAAVPPPPSPTPPPPPQPSPQNSIFPDQAVVKQEMNDEQDQTVKNGEGQVEDGPVDQQPMDTQHGGEDYPEYRQEMVEEHVEEDGIVTTMNMEEEADEVPDSPKRKRTSPKKNNKAKDAPSTSTVRQPTKPKMPQAPLIKGRSQRELRKMEPSKPVTRSAVKETKERPQKGYVEEGRVPDEEPHIALPKAFLACAMRKEVEKADAPGPVKKHDRAKATSSKSNGAENLTRKRIHSATSSAEDQSGSRTVQDTGSKKAEETPVKKKAKGSRTTRSAEKKNTKSIPAEAPTAEVEGGSENNDEENHAEVTPEGAEQNQGFPMDIQMNQMKESQPNGTDNDTQSEVANGNGGQQKERCSDYKSVRDAKPEECKYCRKTFRVQGSRIRHQAIWHQDLQRQPHKPSGAQEPVESAAPEPTETSVSAPREVIGTIVAHPSPKFLCKICNAQFDNIDDLLKDTNFHAHQMAPAEAEGAHPSSKFLCKICNAQFDNIDDFLKDTNFHAHQMTPAEVEGKRPPAEKEKSQKGEIPCDECNRTFYSKNTLTFHMFWTHGKKHASPPIESRHNRVFSRKDTRRLHAKERRAKEKNLPQEDTGSLEYLNRNFSRKDSQEYLKLWLLAEDRSLLENQTVQEPIQSEESLNSPQEQPPQPAEKSPKSPWYCEECDRCFPTKNSLGNHKMNQQQDWVLCPRCDECCHGKETYMEHMQKHASPDENGGTQPENQQVPPIASPPVDEAAKLFSCTFCTKKFASELTRYEHEKTHPVFNRYYENVPIQSISQKLSLSPPVTPVNPQIVAPPVPPKTFQCTFCPRKFDNDFDHKEHEKLHPLFKFYPKTFPTPKASPSFQALFSPPTSPNYLRLPTIPASVFTSPTTSATPTISQGPSTS